MNMKKSLVKILYDSTETSCINYNYVILMIFNYDK